MSQNTEASSSSSSSSTPRWSWNASDEASTADELDVSVARRRDDGPRRKQQRWFSSTRAEGDQERRSAASGRGGASRDILLDDGEGGSVGYSPPPPRALTGAAGGPRDRRPLESAADELEDANARWSARAGTTGGGSADDVRRQRRRRDDDEYDPDRSMERDAAGGPGAGGRVTPFEAKAIAAVTGAVATSLLMTPFDVLKVRMQTHTPRVRSSPAAPAAPAAGITPADVCCQTVAPNVPSSTRSSSTLGSTLIRQRAAESLRVATGGGGGGGSVAMAPAGCINPSKWTGIWGETVTLDEAMDRLARQRARAAPNVLAGVARGGGGFWAEIGVVMSETGVKGLWKGVGTGLAMSIPSSAIYMLGYDVLLRALTPYLTPTPAVTTDTTLPGTAGGNPDASYLTPTPFVAGALARTLSATVISPMELFRTRLQALPQPGQPSPTYSSTVASLSALVRSQGVQSLWRGLGPTLWRDVPFSGFYWAAFESLKRFMTGPTIGAQPGLATTFTAGAISGTVAAILTSPFDILKTRRQVFKPSPACSPAALTHRASTIPLLIHVVRTEGWRALTAGLVPRTAKVAPACGIMIGCYEGVGRWLGER